MCIGGVLGFYYIRYMLTTRPTLNGPIEKRFEAVLFQKALFKWRKGQVTRGGVCLSLLHYVDFLIDVHH